MIILQQFDYVVENPNQEIKDAKIKKFIYDNLEKGLVIFSLPEKISVLDKNLKRNYKVGFLFDFISNVYPLKSKEEKYQIISDKFFLWFTYRQFHNVNEEYARDRDKYYTRPELINNR